jgi:hypothetical protein
MRFSVEATDMSRAPKGIYLVAGMFFFSGLACIAELLAFIFHSLGFQQGRGLLFQSGSLLIVLCGLVLFWLLCYGVVAVARLQVGARWAFLAMTVFLLFRFVTAPATRSVLYSAQWTFVLRIVLLLPVVAACIYLWRFARAQERKSEE